MNWTISQTVDLANGYTPIVWPNALMVSGDVGAHTWEVTVLEDGSAVDLTGATLTGNFLRADGNTVQVSGSVSGSVASVTLTDVCYAVEGKLMGSMKLIKVGVTITLCAVIFTVKLLTTGSVIDPGIAYADFTIDASPAGTYADLATLIAEDPDHSKIYITLDDGKWCYHNGSAFVAGGVYQATSIADGSVTPSKLSFNPVFGVRSKNLFNQHTAIAGYYINASGVLAANAGFYASDWIPVSPSTDYYKNTYHLGAYYDASKAFIDDFANGVYALSTPADCAYIRYSIAAADIGTAQLELGTAETSYEHYAIAQNVSSKGLPYADGFISFTVAVNQTKSDNTVAYNELSEGIEDFEDVNCILHLPLPQFYSQTGEPCKLLMICHGAGSGVDTWKEHDGYQAIVSLFNQRGYAVFDCNGFKNDALGWSFWGNPRGVNAWRKAYQYVVNNYNVENQFSIYGFSMGGLTAMQLAFTGFPNIKCIALGSPVLSLEACYNDSSVQAVIQALYGMGETYDASLAVGSDPYAHIVTVGVEDYVFNTLPPIKIWYGSTETGAGTAVEKTYAQEMVAAIVNAGGMAEYREVNGAGHNICYGSNAVCNADYLIFVERFNKIYQ